MASIMTEYTFTLSIGFSNASQEETVTVEDIGFSENDWNNELTEKQREGELFGFWKDWCNNYIDGSWSKK